jgi:hypothetical protein
MNVRQAALGISNQSGKQQVSEKLGLKSDERKEIDAIFFYQP